MQLQGEMDFIFYVFPRTRKCRKSLDFHKPINYGISLYYIWEKCWSWNQGLRTWEVSHKRIMKLSEKKHRLRKTHHGRMSRSEGYFQKIYCRSVGTNSVFAPK